ESVTGCTRWCPKIPGAIPNCNRFLNLRESIRRGKKKRRASSGVCGDDARHEVLGRRRRTLPPGRPGSTIRAAGLNDRVRDGNGWFPRAMAAGHTSLGSGGAELLRFLWRPGGGTRHLGGLSWPLPLVAIWAGQASRAISTARLSTSPCLHLPPIDVLVSNGPSGVLRPGSAHLGGGFPLRCFQRF